MIDINNTITDIDKLIEEIKKEAENDVSIVRKTPDMIEKTIDITKKEQELAKFNLLNELYVLPIMELAQRVSFATSGQNIVIPGFDNFSIAGRMFKLRDYIVSKGYKVDAIISLLPKSTTEVNLLLQAKEKGFDLGFNNIPDLTNQNRLQRAQYFLNYNNTYNNTEVEPNGRSF